jgi:flagellar hook-associated protein 3 FlgL
MKADTVSTLTGHEIMRTALARNQTRLADTLKEFSTGRHADVGRTLGTRLGAVLDMRHVMGDLTALTSTNAIVGGRLESAQSALEGIRKLASGLIDTAISVRQSGAEPTLLAADAKSQWGSVFDMLSVTSDGVYVFSGTNSSAAPVDNYLSEPPGPARTAVIAAFTTEFGFPPDDPQVSTITPAQYQAYLDGPFAALFEDPAWGATFSSATDGVMRDRISLGEEINSSVSVNDAGMRKLFMAMALAIDGGAEQMSADTRQVLSTRIVESANSAVYDIVRQQSEIGMGQERLTQANERISLEKQALQRRVSTAEEVDAYEVAERLGLLMSRIEASYSVTARIQKLSLLNYL